MRGAMLLVCAVCLLEKFQDFAHAADAHIEQHSACRNLNMTVCSVKCSSDCKSYVTPFLCFNPQKLFPRDAQWGDTDVKDIIFNKTLFHRHFYSSKDGTCSRETDVFELPFNECVGPFGPPRPWGEFRCVA